MFTISFWIEFGQILLIFVVSIINLFTIIYFWIIRSKKTYNIYLICGCSRAKIIYLTVARSFIVILIGIISGSIIFSLFAGVLEKFNLITTENPLLYLLVIALIIAVTLVFSIAAAIKSNINKDIYHIEE